MPLPWAVNVEDRNVFARNPRFLQGSMPSVRSRWADRSGRGDLWFAVYVADDQFKVADERFNVADRLGLLSTCPTQNRVTRVCHVANQGSHGFELDPLSSG
jgi:hypothetical protein